MITQKYIYIDFLYFQVVLSVGIIVLGIVCAITGTYNSLLELIDKY